MTPILAATLTLASQACGRAAAKYVTAGDAAVAVGSYREAIAEYEKAGRFQPDNPHIVRQLGLAHKQLGERGQAYTFLEKAQGLEPRDTVVRITLGSMYLTDGRPELAVTEANAVLDRSPKNLEALNLLGSAYLAGRNPARALETYRRIVEAAPADPRARYLVGTALLAEGKPAEAAQEFQAALALAPAFIDPLARLVEVDLSQHRSDLALALVKEHIGMAGDSGRLHELLGSVYAVRGDRELAEQAFRHALAIEPHVADPYVRLSELYWSSGRYDDALANADSALMIDPASLGARMVQGTVYQQKGAFASAERSYEQALAVNPRFADAANNLAALLSDVDGDQARALKFAVAAKQSAPDDPRISDTLGWILYKLGDYQKAVPELSDAAAKLPNEPTVAYHLGMALSKTRDIVSARQSLTRAVASAAAFPERDSARKALAALK